MAREWVDDPAVFGLAWPVFGAMAAISTVLGAATLRHSSPHRIWISALLLMTVGVLAPVLMRNLGSLLLAAVCVGGTFMVITMAGHARGAAVQTGEQARGCDDRLLRDGPVARSGGRRSVGRRLESLDCRPQFVGRSGAVGQRVVY